MEFTEEFLQKLEEYIQRDDFKKLGIDLKIFHESDSDIEKLAKIKKYIENDMFGKLRGNVSIRKFLQSVEAYLKNDDFERDSYSFINYNLVLPIANLKRREGLRAGVDILGHDRKQYIVKEAEGIKGSISAMKNSKDAKYNPIIAYAFFEFLNQPCAKNLLAYEKIIYYYILSENFLKQNEEIYGLNNGKFMDTTYVIDENNNITHRQIMDGIEETINKKELEQDRKKEICKKIRLQYAIQETLKCLICSADQNLGNTSLIVEKDGENIIDINISPAYDLDLSFDLGEEMLKGISSIQMMYRTTQSDKTDLPSIIKEFSDTVEGYEEAIQDIRSHFSDNYIEKIFEIAHKKTGIDKFEDKQFIEKFANFIMRRVAIFKEACREVYERDNKENNGKENI